MSSSVYSETSEEEEEVTPFLQNEYARLEFLVIVVVALTLFLLTFMVLLVIIVCSLTIIQMVSMDKGSVTVVVPTSERRMEHNLYKCSAMCKAKEEGIKEHVRLCSQSSGSMDVYVENVDSVSKRIRSDLISVDAEGIEDWLKRSAKTEFMAQFQERCKKRGQGFCEMDSDQDWDCIKKV